MEFKNVAIGFLLCLSLILLTGFGSGDSGRYQVVASGEGNNVINILDTKTGDCKTFAHNMAKNEVLVRTLKYNDALNPEVATNKDDKKSVPQG